MLAQRMLTYSASLSIGLSVLHSPLSSCGLMQARLPPYLFEMNLAASQVVKSLRLCSVYLRALLKPIVPASRSHPMLPMCSLWKGVVATTWVSTLAML